MLKEEEKEVFDKYKVKTMPTLMIIATNGKEIGRFTGFHPPEEFVEWFEECAAADDNLEKAKALLSKDPKSEEGLYLRALGNLYKQVFTDMEKLAEREPTEANKAYVYKAVWKLAAWATLRFGRNKAPVERKKHLKRLVEIDSKNESGHLLEACFQLGLSERKNPDEMKKYFARIRKLDPQDKSGYADKMAYAEALAPFYSKDYKTVAANLEKFIGEYAKSELLPKAYYHMANCYLKARDVPKAVKAFEKLIKQYPQAREAEVARARLKKLKKQ